MKFYEYLLTLNACKRGLDLVGNKTVAEFWATSERGDDMCWLLNKANLCDLRTLTKIKAMQAGLVKHLMKDKRSLDALQAAHDFAEGKIGEDELKKASYAAAYAAAADADAYSAYAAYAAYAAADAAYAAYAAANAAYAAANAAYTETLKRCADIVRSVIPEIKIEGVE